MNWYQIFLLVVQFLISVVFIIIVTMQTTKNEGLGGTIGGNMTPNFKGKPGYEEKLQDITRYLGIAWFAVGIIAGIAFRNYTGG